MAPPKQTPAISFDRIWHFRSQVRRTLRILVVFLDNIPDALKAPTQDIASKLLSTAGALLDEHNLELDHAADPVPFFSWRPRAIDTTALDSLETDMDDIQNALLRIPRGGRRGIDCRSYLPNLPSATRCSSAATFWDGRTPSPRHA